MRKKLQKLYPIYYNLLIAQDLWQANFVNNILKELIKLNVNTDTRIKGVIFDELNISIGTILECTCFKDDLIECKCLCCKKNYQQEFDENFKERLFNRSRFSNHSKNKFISLF